MTRLAICCTAIAHSGVGPAGFHTTGSPHTAAIALFQDQTATGKLNAVITPTTPSGCHCSIIRCAGRSEASRQSIELARQSDREVADIDHFLDFAVSFGADLAHFKTDEIAQRLLHFPQRIPEVADNLAAFGRRNHAPFVESAARLRPRCVRTSPVPA